MHLVLESAHRQKLSYQQQVAVGMDNHSLERQRSAAEQVLRPDESVPGQ
jgi:hypothetical protein